MDNKVMNQLSYGLFVLSAKDGDKDNGCIINTATQVTTSPNRIVVQIQRSAHALCRHNPVLAVGIAKAVELLSAGKVEYIVNDIFHFFGHKNIRT